MKTSLAKEGGFSLIEIVVVIVVLGILAAIVMQSMTTSVDDIRRVETELELETLAHAIIGDPSLYANGARCDFGYVGDIGAFPPNLRALVVNPGYETWGGPYIPAGFTEDTTGYLIDAWGERYRYSGGTKITSVGGGSSISRKIASSAGDYLINDLTGMVRDAGGSVPGTFYMDSVDISISIPDGRGGMTTRYASPDSSGNFVLTSLPVGIHPLRAIYLPDADTVLRYVAILPRHRNDPPQDLRFGAAYFSSGSHGAQETASQIP